MGKIIGWGSFDDSTNDENPLQGHGSAGDQFPHSSSDEPVVTYEVEGNVCAVFEPDKPASIEHNSYPIVPHNKDSHFERMDILANLEQACEPPSIKCGEQLDTSKATKRNTLDEIDLSLEITSRETRIPQATPERIEVSKTQRICLAISKLELVRNSTSYSNYCDITKASEKTIEALIISANPNELDFFRILEELQRVISRQGKIASAHGTVVKSPNLNNLIDFISSIATK